MTTHDPIRHPAHYTMYPVEVIDITRHLGFCLGNAVKYVLRAPYKGGVEDCDKALKYLALEFGTPQPIMGHYTFLKVAQARKKLTGFLRDTDGDALWRDISFYQAKFLDELKEYLSGLEMERDRSRCFPLNKHMRETVRELSRVLSLRDTTGQIYEGMTGLPQVPEEEDE